MKKICIVSYYWPPAGGPGVQRWLKFTQYLPDFDIKPYVYIPENPSYPIIDNSLEKEINPAVQIIKQPIWEPYKIAEKFTKNNKNYKAGQFDSAKKQGILSQLSIFIRGNFFIPDARKFWVKPSLNFLKEYLTENQIDVLITTGPPHSLHLIGLGLKKELPDLKWIADFRDPWTQISYHTQLKLTPFAKKKHQRLEKEVLSNADLVLSTSFTDRDNFKKLGAKKVECITNGFDSEINTKIVSTEKFTLSYIGMLEVLRNPVKLWKALIDMIDEIPEFKENFELKFVGKISDDILNVLNKTSLKENIVNKGYLSHQESVEEMLNSDILLITNFENEKSKGIIPGKLFEYMASGRTILSIGPKHSDVEIILKETESGQHFYHLEKDEIQAFLIREYSSWKIKNEKKKINLSSIQQYHRKNLSQQLAKAIDKL